MKKTMRKAPFIKTIATVTAACFFWVSTSAFAFDPEFSGRDNSARIYGLGLSVDLDFSTFKLVGFSHQPMTNLSGSSDDSVDSIISIEDGVVKTQLPLVTLGDSIKYPGIFYNHNGPQFYDHVIRATSGEESEGESESLVGLYVLGLLACGGLVFAMASSSSDNDDEQIPVEDIGDVNNTEGSSNTPDIEIVDGEVAPPVSQEAEETENLTTQPSA